MSEVFEGAVKVERFEGFGMITLRGDFSEQAVKSARAVFRITGKGAREVLAKGAPVDLSKDAFGPGQIRRTRLGQVACAFWMSGEDQFDLICFGSVSEFVFDWLSTAGKDGSLPNYL